MKKLFFIVLMLSTLSLPGFAANFATAAVEFTISSINEISITAGNDTMTITSPTTPVTDSSSKYNFSTNLASQKITGRFSVTPASTLVFSINLADPVAGATAGEQTLSTTDVDLVTTLGPGAEENLGITFKATADYSDTPGDYVYTVTLTITN